MKKVVVFILISILIGSLVFAFTGCSKIESIKVFVPDGAPALGMSYLMKEFSEIDGVQVTYKVVEGTTGIRAAVAGGEADVAIMPTNMAATLYNGGVDIRLVGTNSYGVLYMISNQEGAFTLDSLKGKVVHMVGQGGTPEAVLKKIFAANNIEVVESDEPVQGKVALKFYGDGKEIIQGGLSTGVVEYAVLGEPAISNATQKFPAYSIVLDLQAAWNTATGSDAGYPQTCLVVKGSVAKKAKDLVVKIAQLTLECSNALKTDAAPYVEYLKEKEVTVALAGVARANIAPAFGSVAKADVEAYLTVLKDFKSVLIGGKLPDEKFYFTADELETLNSSAN